MAKLAVLGIALASEAPAGLREETNRLPIYAARRDVGTPLPYVPVRVGDERRYALAASGREQLALRPSQVGAGGRVFVFTKVPAELGDETVTAEMLVWRAGTWLRRRVVQKQPGRLGHLSATVLVDGAPPGAIPTAVFRRSAEFGKTQSLVSMPFKVPSKARLKFGYSFDEWDWSGLSPVRLSVAAVVTDEDADEPREVTLYREKLDPAATPPGWLDAVVDLASVKNEEIRLIFRAEPAYVEHTMAPHVVWSAPAVVAGKPSRDMPSVVLVLLDGVRASSLGCCGGPQNLTPYLDRTFEKEGAVFERAVTQAVETIPAHMSLLTGLNPCVHGVLSARQTLAGELETFVQTMSAGGYATAAFTDAAGFAAEIGFGRGFDVFHQHGSLDAWSVEGTARPAFERALEWAKRHNDEPFVLVVHTRQAKPPYVPPRDFVSSPPPSDDDERDDDDGDDNDAPDRGPFVLPGTPGTPGGIAAQTTADAAVASEKLRYERELRYLDDVLAGFVPKLDETSPPERTLWVVTSAHGEEFLEHGAREHGTHLYDESVRVPLLLRGAGVRDDERYDEVVGLIDVAPTVLEIAGFDAPQRMQGASFAKQVRKGQKLESSPRISEAHSVGRKLAAGLDTGWKPPAFAISDSEHKLIAYVVEERRVFEAYDLASDPGERANLLDAAVELPAWTLELRSALEAYTGECKAVAHPPGRTETLPVSTLFKLRAFGYL